MADDLRKKVGIVLRFPVVMILWIIWMTCFWWWIVGGTIVLALIVLALQPVVYPIAYTIIWLYSAFVNSNDKILPGYWDNYPDGHFDEIGNSFTLGFRTLHKWILEGFD